MRLLEAAGMPPGVINFLPGDAIRISNTLLDSPELAGMHSPVALRCSTRSGNARQRTSAAIARIRAWSARPAGRSSLSSTRRPIRKMAVAIARGGFKLQEQVSAASRVYVPQSLWGEVRDRTVAMMKDIKMGDVRDFRTHGRGHRRQEVVREDRRVPGSREAERQDRSGRHGEGRRRLLHRADARRDDGPGLQAPLRGNLRPRRHGERLCAGQVGRDAVDGRPARRRTP